eukprot:m.25390 g.25390  ORF g.25390 m.25390 type:complete len:410 (-) comp5762_c0_seq1:785-2014(-)
MSAKRKKADSGQPRFVRRKKEAERILTAPIPDLAPESNQMKRLLDLERKIDYYAEKTRQDITPFQPSEETKEKRTIRLYISHISVPNPTEDDPTAMKWSLRIEGRLLEKPNATYRRREINRKKFASFLNDVFVEFDKEKFGHKDRNVQWQRTPATVDADGFEITRSSTLPVTAKISFKFEQTPVRYKLNLVLSKLLQIDSSTVVEVNNAVWEYIRANNLRDSESPDVINCDAALQEVFGVETLKVSELAKHVGYCLLPPSRIELEHVIQLEDNLHNFGQDIYDVDLFLETNFTPNPLISSASHDLESLDKTINEHLEALERAKERREFLLSFADNPQKFILTWVAAQVRDNTEAKSLSSLHKAGRQSATFYERWTEPATLQYLNELVDKKNQERTLQISSSATTTTTTR